MFETYFNSKWLKTAILVTALLFLFTHIPQEMIPSPLRKSGIDKLEHVLAYGVITFLFLIALRTSLTVCSALLLLVVVSVIGAFDELTQIFVNRTASITDLIADIAGILCVLIFSTVRRLWFLRATL
jgi:VanZ family protein